MIPWIKQATDDDVAVSSRIRLARNLKGEFFPSIMDFETGDRVYGKVKNMLLPMGVYSFARMKDVDAVEKHAMVERHIISKELETGKQGGLAKLDDESVVIMINEEDHLRLQTINPGFEIDKAFNTMMDLHEPLKNEFAYDKQFGYLTACPTNAGTGLRASTMLHIPAIMMTGQLQNITNTIAKMGMTLRGIYGEGSDAVGNMVQLSNQITLGLNEREITDNLKAVASRLIENERNARQVIYENKASYVTDKIMRSLGILKYAKRLSSKETISMLSDIKMGISVGVIAGIEHNEVHSLMMDTAPCQLQYTLNKPLNENERDEIRAAVVKKALADAREA